MSRGGTITEILDPNNIQMYGRASGISHLQPESQNLLPKTQQQDGAIDFRCRAGCTLFIIVRWKHHKRRQ